MTEEDASTESTPPETGIAEIDQALAAVQLGESVSEHHQQLSAAVEVLQRVLRTPQS